MMGSRAATLVNLGSSSIHGQMNIALQFRLDGEDTLNQGTVACESAPPDLKVGERVQLEFVLGNVMRVTRIGA